MGMLVLFCFLGGFVMNVPLTLLGFNGYKHALPQARWMTFIKFMLAVIVVAALAAGLAVAIFSLPSAKSPPSDADFLRAFFCAALLPSSPGLGVLAVGFALKAYKRDA